MMFIIEAHYLTEGSCRRVDLMYQGAAASALLLRHRGEVKAYLNQCVHMPRTLDCESNEVFDPSSGYLRCSMHGIVYSSMSGESLSEICRGKKLTAIRVVEREQRIYCIDRRIKSLIQ